MRYRRGLDGIYLWFIFAYMFKTILLSELFTTDRYLWKKDFWSQRIIQVLELACQGVTREEIPSFFIPRHNLLTVADYENKLRQYVLEDMLNQVKGLDLAYTPEDARETENNRPGVFK